MNRDELVALVRRIIDADVETEEEHDRLVETFESNVPHPEASSLIFCPELVLREQRELTPEEIVDIALSYEPIALGPASEPLDPS